MMLLTRSDAISDSDALPWGLYLQQIVKKVALLLNSQLKFIPRHTCQTKSAVLDSWSESICDFGSNPRSTFQRLFSSSSRYSASPCSPGRHPWATIVSKIILPKLASTNCPFSVWIRSLQNKPIRLHPSGYH